MSFQGLVFDASYGGMLLIGMCSMILACTGAFLKEKLFLSEPLVMLLIGLFIRMFVISEFNVIVLEDLFMVRVLLMHVCRFAMAMQIMSIAFDLPKGWLRGHVRDFVLMSVVVTLSMFVCTWVIVSSIMTSSSLLTALIAACLTPTDPVLCNSLIAGRFGREHVSESSRYLLMAESATNDGTAELLLRLIPFLLLVGGDPGLIGSWSISQIFKHVLIGGLLSITGGALIGFGARWILRATRKRGLTDALILPSFALSLAIAVFSGANLLGVNELFAVLGAGLAFASDKEDFAETSPLQHSIDNFLNVALFLAIGIMFPIKVVQESGLGRYVFIACVVLVFRRLPLVIIMRKFIPSLIRTQRLETIFVGWFGPIGIGSIHNVLLLVNNFESRGISKENADAALALVFVTVLVSALIHGFTVPLFHLGICGPNLLSVTLWVETIDQDPLLLLDDDELMV